MNKPWRKKCTSCGEWKDATTENFYVNTSHGRKKTRDGRPYFRSKCKTCIRAAAKKHREHKRRRPSTQEEKDRAAAVKAARHAAYQKLAQKYEVDFQIIYAKELEKRNIRLTRYKGIQIKAKNA